MAVAPTGDIFKTLEFDGESSKDYGVYITGEAVFNAPERDIEMISIPGRNGAFALDKGRFENIEVRYPAGIFADNELDFAEAISDFRNFLCSKKGYCRLTDDYNPDEYRLAIYRSGLEVTPAMLRGGEFEIVFDCKPQRYLMSGEAPINASNNEVIFNPTLYEAHPLLEVDGYGTLNVNGVEIEIEDELVGDVTLYQSAINTFPFDVTFSDVYIAPGDEIELAPPMFYVYYDAKNTGNNITNAAVVSWSGDAASSPSPSYSSKVAHFDVIFTNPTKFYYGTPATKTVQFTGSITQGGVTSYANNVTVSLSYDGNKTITFSTTAKDLSDYTWRAVAFVGSANQFTIHSTATTFGHPTYIDCDLGEAYAIDNGVVSSLNSYIALGSALPKLSVGQSEITFDNTIYDLKVTPRWWKV